MLVSVLVEVMIDKVLVGKKKKRLFVLHFTSEVKLCVVKGKRNSMMLDHYKYQN